MKSMRILKHLFVPHMVALRPPPVAAAKSANQHWAGANDFFLFAGVFVALGVLITLITAQPLVGAGVCGVIAGIYIAWGTGGTGLLSTNQRILAPIVGAILAFLLVLLLRSPFRRGRQWDPSDHGGWDSGSSGGGGFSGGGGDFGGGGASGEW